MKKRYEKNNRIIISSIIFFIGVVGFISFLFMEKLVLYRMFDAVVFNTDVLVLVLDDNELKMFYKNKVLYIENKNYKYDISNIEKDVLTREGVKYNQVFIKVDISDMYKVNDVLKISVMEKNVKCINMFRLIWEGD